MQLDMAKRCLNIIVVCETPPLPKLLLPSLATSKIRVTISVLLLYLMPIVITAIDPEVKRDYVTM